MAPAASPVEVLKGLTEKPQDVDEAQLDVLEKGLATLADRKDEVLRVVSSAITQIQNGLSAERDDVKLTAKNKHIEMLQRMQNSLRAAGAQPGIGATTLNQIGDATKSGVVAGAELTKDAAVMTGKNLDLLIRQQPWLTFLGLGAVAWGYHKISKSQQENPSWWKRVLLGVATFGLTVAGVNLIAQHAYPNDAAKLEK